MGSVMANETWDVVGSKTRAYLSQGVVLFLTDSALDNEMMRSIRAKLAPSVTFGFRDFCLAVRTFLSLAFWSESCLVPPVESCHGCSD
jgi:hypothetical protein